MTSKSDFDQLAEDIEHKVRGIVDDHPLTRNLSDVARRNMAYMAGCSALSALTHDELASIPFKTADRQVG